MRRAHAPSAFEQGTDPCLNKGTDPSGKGPVPAFNKRGKTVRLALCAVAAALWTAFIFSNSLKPAYASSKDSQWLLRLARNVLPQLTEHSLRKAAHFGEVAILGVLWVLTCLALLTRRKKAEGRDFWRSAAWLTAAGALTAGIDETIQFFSPGRAPQITDVLLDIAGFVSGAAIAAAIAAAVIALRARRPAPPP